MRGGGDGWSGVVWYVCGWVWVGGWVRVRELVQMCVRAYKLHACVRARELVEVRSYRSMSPNQVPISTSLLVLLPFGLPRLP